MIQQSNKAINKRLFKIFFFWILFWLLQSVLMSGGQHIDFYLIKNIVIVSLQAIIALTNLYVLYPYFFEKRKFILYTIISIAFIYIIFTLSFFFIDAILSASYSIQSNYKGIQFSTDFWSILSGSSFYSLALLCSTLYKLLTVNRTIEIENKKMKQGSKEEVLSIKEGNTTHFINIDEILFIKGLREYVVWNTEDQRIISLESLKSIEEKLGDKGFKRVHKSYIINTNKINALSSSSVKVGGEEIPIGRKYRENTQNLYDLM